MDLEVTIDPEAHRRREQALRAVAEVAQTFGVDASSARVLRDWNDTIVHLAPSPLVARVATSTIRSEFSETVMETFSRELAVVDHAARRGAPVVPPSRDPPAGPHSVDESVLTIWPYVDLIRGEVNADEAGIALGALHNALADYSGPLPPLDDRLDLAEAFIRDQSALPALPQNERELLARAFLGLREQIDSAAKADRALHGGAHDGNLLRSRDGVRWIDFDTACRGPAEWDVAHLPQAAAKYFPEIDTDLLALMRDLVSAEVAIWCWRAYGRAREVNEAAHFHLERIKVLAPESV